MYSKTSSTIDRKTAGRLLGVSTRTIDRYIRRGKLSAHQQNGRIWLNKKEIMEFPALQKIPVTTSMDMERSRTALSKTPSRESDGSFYKDLYGESRRALTEYQQKLENANYRIGQLESQILHPGSMKIPERNDSGISFELTKRELQDRERELVILKELAKKERASRIIFALLTYLLLAALPVIWYLMR